MSVFGNQLKVFRKFRLNLRSPDCRCRILFISSSIHKGYIETEIVMRHVFVLLLSILSITALCGEPAVSKEGIDALRTMLADYPEDILEEKPYPKRDALVALLKKQGESALPNLTFIAKNERSIPVAAGAAFGLGELGDLRAAPVLSKLIAERSLDYVVARSARRALGRLGDSGLVPALLPRIQAEDADADETLHALSHPVHLKPLIEMLKHKDQRLRASAAEALANYTEKDAVNALIGALQDENEGVVMLTARSLGTIGDAAAVPALQARSAAARDIFLRKYLKEALESIAEKAGSSLLAARKIKPGKEGLPQLIEALKDKDLAVRKAAAAALKGLFEEAAPAVNDLIPLLKDPDLEMRNIALETLVGIGGASVEPLANCLATADALQLDKALAALFRILYSLEKVERGDNLTAKLIPMMDKGPQMASAAHSLFVLMGPEAATAVPKLIPQLDNADANYALGVTYALGSIGQKAVPDLITALKSKNSVMRKRAAFALSVVGVKGKLIAGMKTMGGANPGAEFLDDLRTEGNAVDAIPALIDALKDADVGVRYNAVVAFRRMKGDAKPALAALGALQKDPDESIRKAAAEAIAKINAPANAPRR
jgi:HEAT repeat protein